LSTQTLRWTRSGLLPIALLALAACAHAPYSRPGGASKTVVRITLGPPAGAVPANAPTANSAPAPGGAAPGSAGATASSGQSASANAFESLPARSPEPVAGINPADYADLFDRMRAGFKLEDDANRRINEQLDWFVDNPEWVQRAFQRAELYMYSIVTQVEARGMPLEIALLPVIESAYQPYAYSRARAVGLWQFMPQTAARFGLKQNWWYDGRRDVIESTRAALDYLQYLHTEFNGDWLLAIAAYDCGEATVDQAIRENQRRGRPTDFWHLRLPRETRAYVPKLLAMKRLVESPETYGLSFSPIPNKPYFTRVQTHGQIDLRVAAEIAGVSPDVIYELNPAFHRWATDPSGPFYLLVPTGAAPTFRANVVQLTSDERLRVNHYVVRRGDTLERIARRFRTHPTMIRELNRLGRRTRLVVGTSLEIPSDVDVHVLPRQVLLAAARVDARYRRLWEPRMRVVVHRGDSLWAIARRNHMDVHTLAMINGLRLNDTLHAGERLRLTRAAYDTERTDAPRRTSPPSHFFRRGRRVTYIVRAGDTLYHISRLFQVSVREIMNWNRMVRASLWPGQHLRILLAER
jgi:peptidoglycan lytic transglycosylase D